MIEEEDNLDVLDHTFGAWNRKESPDSTVDKSREAFQRSMERHRK